MTKRQIIGLIIAPTLLLLTLTIDPPEGLKSEGWKTAGVAACMATLWICETIPLAATALIPLCLLPSLGIMNAQSAATPYANPVIFLFMGGFIIALAIERWKLHLRIALHIIALMGTCPSRIIWGFMLATAFFSMWISNTATVLMIYPIALSILALFKKHHLAESDLKKFSNTLLLSIAYAAGIGGLGTIIGTPPNALMVGYLQENHNINIGFAQWMLFALPLVIVALPLTHFILSRICFPIKNIKLPEIREVLFLELQKLGPLSYNEITVAIIAASTGLTWILRPQLNKVLPLLSDTSISIGFALLLFFIPARASKMKTLMNWDAAKKLPWGIFLLFGGGLSLAASIQGTGLLSYIGELSKALNNWPTLLILILLLLLVWATTELMSNTATISTFLPIAAAIALGINKDLLLLIIPATIMSSCAFMLPVATPPNAIMFASGHVKLKNMVYAGIHISLLLIVLILILTYTLGPLIFKMKL